MKKLIGISTITLGLLLGANSALAENQIGESLCGFTAKVMHNAGYVDNASYTGEGLLQLFRNINVVPNGAKIVPGCVYHTYYSCNVQNNLATASLCLSHAHYKGRLVSREQVVSWPVTKPNYQDQDYNFQ